MNWTCKKPFTFPRLSSRSTAELHRPVRAPVQGLSSPGVRMDDRQPRGARVSLDDICLGGHFHGMEI